MKNGSHHLPVPQGDQMKGAGSVRAWVQNHAAAARTDGKAPCTNARTPWHFALAAWVRSMTGSAAGLFSVRHRVRSLSLARACATVSLTTVKSAITHRQGPRLQYHHGIL